MRCCCRIHRNIQPKTGTRSTFERCFSYFIVYLEVTLYEDELFYHRIDLLPKRIVETR